MPPSASLWGDLGVALERAERWLLPGSCLLCGETQAGAPGSDPLICGLCLNRLASLPDPQCRRCGQPLSPGIACRLCAGWPEPLVGVRSAVWLDRPARRAVHLLKYGGWWRLAEHLAQVIVTRLGVRVDPALQPVSRPVIVPIPLSPARQRERGYNQSAVLAEALAKLTGLSVADPLRRRRDTGTQTALTPEARRANLAGAFVAMETPPRHSILVDDVFTTGATLAEAAGALLEAGAAVVGGLTFARAMRPLADAASAPDQR